VGGGLRLLSAMPSCCCGDSAQDAPESGKPLVAIPLSPPTQPPLLARIGADQAKAFVGRQWAAPRPRPGAPDCPQDDLDRFLARAATHILAVSGMAFQDAWTLDLERLRGCCIHEAVLGADQSVRLIPFCAYNLTAADGTPLYRTTGQERPLV
ncbi:MAG: radical SAM protein, partial [Desulfovibrio sp.]